MALSTVVFVGESRKWISDLVEKAKKLKLGPGSDPKTDIGPVISEKAKNRIVELVESAKNEGADVILDGVNVKMEDDYQKGNFIGATVITGVKPSMQCYKA